MKSSKKFAPPHDFTYHDPHVVCASPPTTLPEVAFLNEKIGVRKFFLVDAPLTTVLREAGRIWKLRYSQSNRSAFDTDAGLLVTLVKEIDVASVKGSNVCLLGVPEDIALVCAAHRISQGWRLVHAVREYTRIAQSAPTNSTLDLLEAFDELVG
jgi:hypothetical protein